MEFIFDSFSDESICCPKIFLTFFPEIIETFFEFGHSPCRNLPTSSILFSPTTICLGSYIVWDIDFLCPCITSPSITKLFKRVP